MDSMQPGQLIAPHNTDEPQSSPPSPGAPVPDRPAEEPGENPNPAPNPAPTPEPSMTAHAVAPALAVADHEAGWRFNGHPSRGHEQQAPLPSDISWTASEFIEHQKSPKWYGALMVVSVVGAVGDYLLTKDILSTIIILLAAAAFGFVSARKPHTQEYILTHSSLQIGLKTYALQDFKNFSVSEDGAIASVVFMPLRRFMPPLTIYVAPDMEDQVLNFLGQILPFAQPQNDAVDSLIRHIRF